MNAIKLNVLLVILWEVKIICKQNQICFVEFEIHKYFSRINKVMKPGYSETHFNSEEEKEQCIWELSKTDSSSRRGVFRISVG